MDYEAVFIGVSAGGTEALRIILTALPAEFSLPVVIVQHRLAGSDDFLERNLDNQCKITVKQAEEKENIQPGTVFFAPPGYHLMVEDDMTFSLSIEEPVNFARPSVDVLFETAADVYGPKAIGIILTGANNDGSKGMQEIKERGGLTIVQDPSTAYASSMPRAAITSTKVDRILQLEEIGPFLTSVCHSETQQPKSNNSDNSPGVTM